MTDEILELDLSPGAGGEGWLQPIAGLKLWTRSPLVPWAVPASRPRSTSLAKRHESWRLVYDGPAEVVGQITRVRSWLDVDGGRRIEFEDGELFEIDAAARRVARVFPEGPPGVLSHSRSLGAPLALALASRDIFLLHASALMSEAGVFALVAPSGGGKSTLAAAASTAMSRLHRVADDLLPVTLGDSPQALPHFVQLKLDAAEGYPLAAAPAVPLAAVIEIAHGRQHRETELLRLADSRSFVTLARAGVALRTFDGTLLSRHFEQCVLAVRSLGVFRLTFPSGAPGLQAAINTLAELGRSMGSTPPSLARNGESGRPA